MYRRMDEADYIEPEAGPKSVADNTLKSFQLSFKQVPFTYSFFQTIGCFQNGKLKMYQVRYIRSITFIPSWCFRAKSRQFVKRSIIHWGRKRERSIFLWMTSSEINFSNHENSAKPRNRCSNFFNFILPKINHSTSLNERHFNRLKWMCNCCIVPYVWYCKLFGSVHYHHQWDNRAWSELRPKTHKPIYSLQYHSLEFHKLIMNKETRYSTFLSSPIAKFWIFYLLGNSC